MEDELELEEIALDKMAALELKGQDSFYYEKMLLDHQIKKKQYESKYGIAWISGKEILELDKKP